MLLYRFLDEETDALEICNKNSESLQETLIGIKKLNNDQK